MVPEVKCSIRELPSIVAPAMPAMTTASRVAAKRDEALPLDRRQLINRCLGRIELAERLIASFQTRFPNETREIERCLAEGDDTNLARLIHQLKGAAANVSAPILHGLLTRMEQSARAGDRPAVVDLMGELHAAWDHLKTFLEAAPTPVPQTQS